ncbi:hypothetical protein [Hymenobacter lapidiphilus]|uniref:Uncharacterized protein n=1 Tax=Hymenobacter lapidiphilus TaxID=2608003 RepID=A0A7Y7PSG7_9BACT|nr:hypothetical protein [Hymenobacter lapidiphilus]NVO33213.1 hypothetical protein [Hymenobacter lapidiphilus]
MAPHRAARQVMETLAARIARKKQELQAAAPRIALAMATAGLSLVRLRIERDGLPGKSYSTLTVPTFLFYNRTLNAGGRAYIKQNKRGTWGALRGAQGLPSDRVTLGYTNRMWNSLTATGSGATGTVFTARVVSTDREGADRVRYNRARYGDFLQPNAAETKRLGLSAEREITRILQSP